MVSFIWTICYLSVLVGLSAYGVHRYFIIYLFLKNRKRESVPAGRFEKLPVVTVQLPIFNEVYVVERLLRSVSKLDYPRNRLQIQVLDDSTDDTREITADCAAELRKRGFDVELIHRADRTGFKAGALERGLATARGEFVCILDADFVPPPHLLRETVDFFTDPKVGMIQTRWGHLNRGYSLLTRVQAMFLDGHLVSNFAYLLLACLVVLLHPSTGGPQSGWVRTLLIDVPIFLTASVSVAVFYICAQRELHPRTWMKEIMLLPCLLALGVGLSLNNARAVLEAVFNHKSDFTRTPKYGIERKAQPWRNCRYMPLKSVLPAAEMFFAVYFSYFVWYAIEHGQFLSVPFLLMFQFGFLYVSFCSVIQWLPKFNWNNGRAPDALPA